MPHQANGLRWMVRSGSLNQRKRSMSAVATLPLPVLKADGQPDEWHPGR